MARPSGLLDLRWGEFPDMWCFGTYLRWENDCPGKHRFERGWQRDLLGICKGCDQWSSSNYFAKFCDAIPQPGCSCFDVVLFHLHGLIGCCKQQGCGLDCGFMTPTSYDYSKPTYENYREDLLSSQMVARGQDLKYHSGVVALQYSPAVVFFKRFFVFSPSYYLVQQSLLFHRHAVTRCLLGEDDFLWQLPEDSRASGL